MEMMSRGTQKDRPNTAEASVGGNTAYYTMDNNVDPEFQDTVDHPVFERDYDEKAAHQRDIAEAERLTLEMQSEAKLKHLVASVKDDLDKTYGDLHSQYEAVRNTMNISLHHESRALQEQMRQH
eukprot:15542047-Heterocapsa_arctica.AAC.1